MTKLLLILLIGLSFEAAGVVFLNRGLKQMAATSQSGSGKIARVIRAGATNPNILAGVALEAVFFGTLLYLMSQGTVSFIWPLTSLGFVFTTVAARFILHEEVSVVRWGGVLLIMLGAGLITYSEKILEQKPSAPPAHSAAAGGE
jgi:drug/metabolite transporter (DMT)-like permease